MHDASAFFMQTGGIGSEVQNLPAELVSHDDIPGQIHHGRGTSLDGRLNHRFAVLQGMQIGTADPTYQCTYQDFAIEGFRFSYRVDDNFGIAHYCCSHFHVSLIFESTT
jgi:hypothetical protein